jgi:hypothetical protein
MHHQRALASTAAALLLALFFGGCALPGRHDWQLWRGNDLVRVGGDVDIYRMFDNSRDWGPSYLLGPPDHHFGYGTRVDDSRADPPPRSLATESSAANSNMTLTSF